MRRGWNWASCEYGQTPGESHATRNEKQAFWLAFFYSKPFRLLLILTRIKACEWNPSPS